MRFCLLIMAMLLGSCNSPTHRLGQGYRLIHWTEDTHGDIGAFEVLAHHSDLYYQQQRLGSVGRYSISPSGRFALFEGTGKIMLFDRQTRTTLDVTDGIFAIPRGFRWNEAAGYANIDYYEKHAPSRIRLEQ